VPRTDHTPTETRGNVECPCFLPLYFTSHTRPILATADSGTLRTAGATGIMTSSPVAVRGAGNRSVRIKNPGRLGVQHDIRRLSQPALVMRAQPIHSLECFLNRWSAVHKTCENFSLQTLEISACQNQLSTVLKSDSWSPGLVKGIAV
jgi:hypothetical protein